MISEKMKGPVANNSAVKEMFEEGKKLEKIYKKENVYDFSLGNPSIPAPKKVNEAIKEIIEKNCTTDVTIGQSDGGNSSQATLACVKVT